MLTVKKIKRLFSVPRILGQMITNQVIFLFLDHQISVLHFPRSRGVVAGSSSGTVLRLPGRVWLDTLASLSPFVSFLGISMRAQTQSIQRAGNHLTASRLPSRPPAPLVGTQASFSTHCLLNPPLICFLLVFLTESF